MKEGALLLGVAGFSYDVEMLLAVHMDIVPLCVLPQFDDRELVYLIQRNAITY